MQPRRYLVCTRDPGETPQDDWSWNPFASALSPWGVRLVVRILYGWGYSDLSVLVERLEVARGADPGAD
jgi:hypothetical protein